jgi:HK97 gp10 family phage protein
MAKRRSTRLEVNMSKVVHKMNGYQASLADGRVREMMKEEAQVIVNNARANSASLSKTVSNSIGFIEKKNYPYNILIGPKYPQGNLAHFFEYGTAPRYTADGNYRGAMEAKPFMRPAIDNNIGNVKRKILIRLQQIVRKLKK